VVERHLAKVNVARSNRVTRFRNLFYWFFTAPSLFDFGMEKPQQSLSGYLPKVRQ
jgi:hypothetical protein